MLACAAGGKVWVFDFEQDTPYEAIIINPKILNLLKLLIIFLMYYNKWSFLFKITHKNQNII
jgi:hypothetical protein